MCRLGFFKEMKSVKKSEPLKAYRWFEVAIEGRNHKMMLQPLNYGDDTWNRKIAKADEVPDDVNANGLYAFFTKEEALNQNPGEGHVLGLISVWGECAMHDDGVRAEFAKIERLYPSNINRHFECEVDPWSFDTIKVPFRKAFAANPVLRNLPLTRLNASKITAKF